MNLWKIANPNKHWTSLMDHVFASLEMFAPLLDPLRYLSGDIMYQRNSTLLQPNLRFSSLE